MVSTTQVLQQDRDKLDAPDLAGKLCCRLLAGNMLVLQRMPFNCNGMCSLMEVPIDSVLCMP
jgi:hypothetical protein